MEERNFEREPGQLRRVRPTACPNCGGEMYHGKLRTPGQMDSRIFIEESSGVGKERAYQPLDVWVCDECGYVELHTLPSNEYN